MITADFQCFKVIDVIVNKLSDYFYKNNLHYAILGVSGGIDSTVVAVLLYKVKEQLKEKGFHFRIYGYSLPTNTTNSDELFVSTLVGHAFCDYFSVDNIGEITNNVDIFLNPLRSDDTYKFQSGNIKSRFRMMYLYNAAKELKGCVVGTDNWTEKLLGFSTIGGDDTADIMPIQNLWKTEVYAIANHFLIKYHEVEDYAKCHAITSSIQLAPQDGLGITNSDMDQLGAKDYYEVDKILYAYIVEKQPIEEIVESFDVSTTYKIINRYNNNFKLKLPITITRDEFEV